MTPMTLFVAASTVGLVLGTLGCSPGVDNAPTTTPPTTTRPTTTPPTTTPPSTTPPSTTPPTTTPPATPPPTPTCPGIDSIAAHVAAVGAVSYSRDGQLFASYGSSASPEDGLKVWRASDRAALWTAAPAYGLLPSAHIVAFSADSALVALPGGRGTRLFRAADGADVKVIDEGLGIPMATVAFSPDGNLLAAGCQCDGNAQAVARIWRVEDGKQDLGFGAPGHQAFAVDFSPDGLLLAVRSAYRTEAGLPRMTVWRVADRTLLWGAETEETPTRRSYVGFSPDGALVVAIGNRTDGAVRVYGIADGALLANLAADRPASAAVSPDGDILAVAAEGGLRLWRTTDWSPISEVPAAFLSVAFAPDGRTLLAGAGDGSPHFFCPGKVGSRTGAAMRR